MRRAFRMPNSLYLLVGILIIIFAFFHPNNTIDVHVHDTMYVITASYFFFALAILFFFFWIVYSAGEKIIYKWSLVWLHFFCTFISALTIVGIMLSNKRYIDLSSPGSFDKFSKTNFIIGIAFIVLAFSQLLFVLNMIVGIVNKLIQQR